MSGRKVDWGAADEAPAGAAVPAPQFSRREVDGALGEPEVVARRQPPTLEESLPAESRLAPLCASFPSDFEALTGKPPFPWQQALFNEFVRGRFPAACNIPTGLGKTSVLAVWLLALGVHARAGSAGFPRRLAYVVNRRTVVDQATREAENLRSALGGRPELAPLANALRALTIFRDDVPLAISTLRGQFADNGEWRDDPARPAIILGTVDMIGSRLLFSGYGCGFKSKPTHAGLLGQDTILIHDEAHLEPAFQTLAITIETEQRRRMDLGRLRVVALTATMRGSGEPFELTAADRKNETVRRRLHATKRLVLHPVAEEKVLGAEVARCALEHRDSGTSILVYLRSLEDVAKLAETLRKATSPERVQVLTGTLRGMERDALVANDPVFARFKPRAAASDPAGSGAAKEIPDQNVTVYLVCTSAGEVGVDISADHMVCDLTPFDSMAQRLGRVNRYGDGAATVDVVFPREFAEKDLLREQRRRTLALLEALPPRKGGHDASPAALAALPAAERDAAFTPEPLILPTTDILLDTWALTSIRGRLPGRPLVADWLHGVEGWQPPETHVAWREEVGVVHSDLTESLSPQELLEDYPLKPHELLRDRTDRVMEHLDAIAARCPEASAWVVDAAGQVRQMTLLALVRRGKLNKPLVALQDCTVLLPPEVGGLTSGLLDGAAEFQQGLRYDVADEWTDENHARRRCRVWDDDEAPGGMRLVRTIDTLASGDDDTEADDSPRRIWRWFVRPRSADDDGSRSALKKQELQPHLETAERDAAVIVSSLGLPAPEALAVTFAARAHDRGKRRAIWQRAIGNRDPRVVLAKSGEKMQVSSLSSYRHELGSMLDLTGDPEFQRLPREVGDLVLHLVAAHHGRGRPHFPEEEVFDPEHEEQETRAAVTEVPRRFGRLQRRYGRWGLAYLESLVRSADALASQGIEPAEEATRVTGEGRRGRKDGGA